MARADLLIDLVRADTKGEPGLFRRALEAIIAEERARQHHVLADRLSTYLQNNGSQGPRQWPSTPKAEVLDSLYVELFPERRLDELVLPVVVERALRELIEEQQRADLLRAHNLEPRHRVLFVGPPGNGKTSAAEALASELAIPLVVVRYEAVIASFLGETAVRLARLFDQVRTRRCVLFFDEFDVVGKERGDPHETGEIKRVVSSLLLQVDALPSYVVVVTATNHAELLDRAVWRRFQFRLELPKPTETAAQELLARAQARLGEPFGVSLSSIAKRLSGASFSEIEEFTEDVQRRFVLTAPNAEMRKIVEEKLMQWQRRYSPTRTSSRK